MKIYTLIENTAVQADLTAEHGLSLYLETDGLRILFDMGQSDAFWDNAEKMGIDLAQVDVAVLSHGHYDHGGGLARFLQGNDHAPVYLSRHAFAPHYNAKGKYIGLEQLRSERLIFTEDTCVIAPGVTLHSCNSLGWKIDPMGLTMEGQQPEDFRHEQYLLIEENGKRICISGCSHKGIVNIARHFQPDVLGGGFHFKGLEPGDSRIQDAAKMLMEQKTVYYTGHCTGQAQFEVMKNVMGKRVFAVSTGTVIEV